MALLIMALSGMALSGMALIILAPLHAADSGRDFSGKWIFDPAAGDGRALPEPPDEVLTVAQRDSALRCSSIAGNGSSAEWVYRLDGSESKYRIGGQTMNSVAKWEGSALLINSLVSGSREYTQMDRWKLSADRATLTITRQVIGARSQSEGVLVYRREGSVAAGPVAARQSLEPAPVESPVLVRRPDPPRPVAAPLPVGETAPVAVPLPLAETAPMAVMVPAGTRIPLMLRNTVDTKHSREGDRIYLETDFPIGVGGRIVIPRGSFVTGTVTQARQPGHVAGKGQLFIRFDTLLLPNGVTRDFRSRLGSAEGSGTVDRQEGKISGERNQAGDARTVATTTGAGATVGVIAGTAAGRAGTGAGIGAAAGAAAGLAHVLLKRGPDATLPRGTIVEMILDRDIQFSPADLRF